MCIFRLKTCKFVYLHKHLRNIAFTFSLTLHQALLIVELNIEQDVPKESKDSLMSNYFEHDADGKTNITYERKVLSNLFSIVFYSFYCNKVKCTNLILLYFPWPLFYVLTTFFFKLF